MSFRGITYVFLCLFLCVSACSAKVPLLPFGQVPTVAHKLLFANQGRQDARIEVLNASQRVVAIVTVAVEEQKDFELMLYSQEEDPTYCVYHVRRQWRRLLRCIELHHEKSMEVEQIVIPEA